MFALFFCLPFFKLTIFHLKWVQVFFSGIRLAELGRKWKFWESGPTNARTQSKVCTKLSYAIFKLNMASYLKIISFASATTFICHSPIIIILVFLLQYEDIMSSRFTMLGLYSLTNLKKFFIHIMYHYHYILAHNGFEPFSLISYKKDCSKCLHVRTFGVTIG